jgi:RNA polymerase sigma factor (TIGR02999 family)
MERAPSDVTELLNRWRNGDAAAFERLLPLVYGELRRIARRHMRTQPPDHTLQPTALIHEAYVRMAGQSTGTWQNRDHFLGAAARAMRHVLVDHARAKKSAKRGGGARAVPIEEGIGTSAERLDALVALDEALSRLEQLHPRQGRVIELRFFGGFTIEETAKILNVSPETVMLDWRAAKAWLHAELDRRS